MNLDAYSTGLEQQQVSVDGYGGSPLCPISSVVRKTKKKFFANVEMWNRVRILVRYTLTLPVIFKHIIQQTALKFTNVEY